MSLPAFLYTVVLRPKPLRRLADAAIRAIVPTRLSTGGATVALNPRDPVISGALTLRVYEKPETRFFCAACKPGMTVLDVGANVGYYTALAMVRIGNGRVIALEPDKEAFEYLQATVAANAGAEAICIRKAASSERGAGTLYSSASNRGDNRLYANEFPGTVDEVEICTVDDLLAELDVAAADLVKIDVQGYEGRVLRGMSRLIRGARDITILMEFWPDGLRQAGDDPERLLAELESAGLELFEIGSKGEAVALDRAGIVRRHKGRSYTSIVAHKGNPLTVRA